MHKKLLKIITTFNGVRLLPPKRNCGQWTVISFVARTRAQHRAGKGRDGEGAKTKNIFNICGAAAECESFPRVNRRRICLFIAGMCVCVRATYGHSLECCVRQVFPCAIHSAAAAGRGFRNFDCHFHSPVRQPRQSGPRGRGQAGHQPKFDYRTDNENNIFEILF